MACAAKIELSHLAITELTGFNGFRESSPAGARQLKSLVALRGIEPLFEP